MSSDPSKYPEAEKFAAAKPDAEKLGQFLDWLVEEKNITLCLMNDKRECAYRGRKYYCSLGRLLNKFNDEDSGECHECDGTGIVDRTYPEYYAQPQPFNQLFEEYFGIDMTRLEQERRAMLDEVRKQND